MSNVPPLPLPEGSLSPEEESKTTNNGGQTEKLKADPQSTANGATVRLIQDEVAALLAFFELLQTWDEDRKII